MGSVSLLHVSRHADFGMTPQSGYETPSMQVLLSGFMHPCTLELLAAHVVQLVLDTQVVQRGLAGLNNLAIGFDIAQGYIRACMALLETFGL